MPYSNNAVDLDLIKDVDNVLGSVDGDVYNKMRRVCRESVENDDVSCNDASMYGRAHEDQNGDDWDTFCRAAGVSVRDAVLDLIEEVLPDGIVLMLLRERLDLNNQHAWACIAEPFMPHPDEVDLSMIG